MRFVLVAMLCQISVVYAQVDFEPQVVIVEECGPPKIISNRSTTGDLNLDGLPDLVTTWSEAGLPAEVQVHPGLGGATSPLRLYLHFPPVPRRAQERVGFGSSTWTKMGFPISSPPTAEG